MSNRTLQPLEVEATRNNAPTGMLGFAFRIHTTMQATSVWHAALYPPPEGVPWSATVRYLRRAGKIEKHLRRVGAWFHLCQREPQWKVAQTIQIEK